MEKRYLYCVILILIVSLGNVMLAAAGEKEFQQCREQLKKAEKAGLLYDLDIDGAIPKATVGPTFYQMPIDAKQRFADTISCFLMAGEKGHKFFVLHDWKVGKRIGKYMDGKVIME